jgi:hypothetical protein
VLGACFEYRHVRPDLGQQILRAMRPQARDGEQQVPGRAKTRRLLALVDSITTRCTFSATSRSRSLINCGVVVAQVLTVHLVGRDPRPCTRRHTIGR